MDADPLHQSSPGMPGHEQDIPAREDIDEILRRKRKAREYKACYPCRQRKVKCDQTVPCKTCVARGHAELCSYHPPSEAHPPVKRVSMVLGNGNDHGHDYSNGSVHVHGGTITMPREDWDRICAKLQTAEQSLAELKGSIGSVVEVSAISVPHGHSPGTSSTGPGAPIENESNHDRAQGIHTHDDFTGQTIHIGASSVPALVMALDRGDGPWPGLQDVLGKKSMLPIFGLDNESATYPFVDLWGLPHGSLARAIELANALPNDSECLSLFRSYRETAQAVYPAVADVETFESDLMLFLINRAGSQGNSGVSEELIFGKSLHWVGLLFSVLASGCQCSALPRKQSELTAKVYMCCAFECLRFVNFLSQATLDNIQTLLVLGNVLSNNMNAGVSWSLMGITVRLSQTLGLHRLCPSTTPISTKVMRNNVWWALLWQDSLLSISYDRASSTTTIDHTVPLNQSTVPGTRTYVESMYRLCKVGLDIVRERQRPQNSHDALIRITEHRQELLDIMADAADYLKDSRRCRSMRDQLEHWVLYLHVSYITSELCRPAIGPGAKGLDLSKTLRKTCIDSLASTVEAFLGLQNVTPFATRSWASVHRSLSSALLLGILGEHTRNERARTLLADLIHVLGDVTSSIDASAAGDLSSPITRSVVALQRLLSIPAPPVVGSHQQSQQHQQHQQQHQRHASASDASSQTSQQGQAMFGADHLNGVWSADGSVLVQSPLLVGHEHGLETHDSPYALMESIVWGAQRET